MGEAIPPCLFQEVPVYPAELIENAEQALSKSIMQLMRSKTQTYITCILLRLTKTFTNETEVARVNQLEIQLNPEFFLGLNDAQKRFLLIHEAWHVPFMNMLRAEGKDPRQWNIASLDRYIEGINSGKADYEIEKLDITTQYNEFVITSMRSMWGMDLSILKDKFGVDL